MMARGEGYLRQRGKVWYFEFSYRGVRYYYRIGAVSKSVAKEIASQIRAKIIRGEYIPEDKNNKPFEEIARFYEKLYLSTSKAREKTKKEHLRKLKNLIAFFGKRAIKNITTSLIEDYKNKRLSEGTTPLMVERELHLLRSVFYKAKEFGLCDYVPKIPFFGVKEKQTLRYLTEEQAQKLLSACPDYLRPAVFFALHTGLRASEIFSLKWEQVDLESGVIRLEREQTKTKEYYTVHLTEPLIKLLKSLPRYEHGYVFTNHEGKPYSTQGYKKAFKTACKKAGIENFRFHDLRHTFASWIAIKSKDLYLVKELLHHKDLRSTQRYAHLTEDYKKQVLESLPNFGITAEEKKEGVIKPSGDEGI